MDRRERINDLTEAVRAAIGGDRAGLWTALPGIVQSYDPAAMTVSVQPAIRAVVEDEVGRSAPVTLPLLVDVPVCFPGGGGFTLTFPIRAGDECLVVFAARCIDGWWQSGGVQPQAEPRMHDLSDGLAVFGPRSQPRVLAPLAHAQDVQLRADDGLSHVAITPGGAIHAKASSSITLEAPEVVIQAPAIRLDGVTIELIGALNLTGVGGAPAEAVVNGTLQAAQDVQAAGVSLTGHVHGGVTPGGGTTGVPET